MKIVNTDKLQVSQDFQNRWPYKFNGFLLRRLHFNINFKIKSTRALKYSLNHLYYNNDFDKIAKLSVIISRTIAIKKPLKHLSYKNVHIFIIKVKKIQFI